MPLETATYIDDLVETNPVGASDTKSQGDNHLRLIKEVLKNSFPNMTGVGVFDLVAALDFIIKSTGNGAAAAAPKLHLRGLNPALADGQYAGSILFEFLSDLGNLRTGVQDYARIDDVSDGTEDVTKITATMKGGVLTDRLVITPTQLLFDGINVVDFPTGTRTSFQQTAAPVGWTKDVTHNNKAMRLVNGTVTTGGTVSFTTAFASKSVAGTNSSTAAGGTNSSTALTAANLAAHTHTFSDTASTGTESVNHTHTQQGTFGTTTNGAHTHGVGVNGSGGGADGATLNGNTGTISITTSSAGGHTHTTTISGQTGGVSVLHTHPVTISGTTGSTGSGTGHTHTFSGTSHTHTFSGTAIDLAVQYVDFIIASKD